MGETLPSSWNTTDSSFHVSPDDEIELHKEVLRFIFCSTWLGVLFTIALAFLTLSTELQRKAPIFALQGLAFALAITYNICEIVYSLRRFDAAFRKPEDGNGPSYLYLVRLKVLDLTLEHIVPICCDLTLLIKVHSFFPWPIYSRTKQCLVLGPLLVLLIPRVVLTIISSYAVWQMETDVEMVPGQSYPVDMGFKWVPLVVSTNQAEFGLQAVYCFYAAVLLLRKAVQFTLGYSNPLSRLSVRRKMRFFLEAMLMTFIPPVAFAMAAAATLQCRSEGYCYYREMTAFLVNTSALFSLLAGSWSSIRRRHGTMPSDTVYFKSPSDMPRGMSLQHSFVSRTFRGDEDSEKGVEGQRDSHQGRGHLDGIKRTESGYFDMDGKQEIFSNDKSDVETAVDSHPHYNDKAFPNAGQGACDKGRRPSQSIEQIRDTASPAPRRTRAVVSPASLARGKAAASPARPSSPSNKQAREVPLLQRVWSECELEVPLCDSRRPSLSRTRPTVLDSSDDDDDDVYHARRLHGSPCDASRDTAQTRARNSRRGPVPPPSQAAPPASREPSSSHWQEQPIATSHDHATLSCPVHGVAVVSPVTPHSHGVSSQASDNGVGASRDMSSSPVRMPGRPQEPPQSRRFVAPAVPQPTASPSSLRRIAWPEKGDGKR